MLSLLPPIWRVGYDAWFRGCGYGDEPDMSKHNIAVTGMGLVCCLGAGVEAVYRRMCEGACGIRTIDRFSPDPYPQQKGGQIPDDLEEALREKYPEDDIAGAMIKAAGLEALEQAGQLPGESADPELGLVLATNFGPMETMEWCWRERVDVGTMDRETFAAVEEFLPRLAAFFGCGGPRVQLSLSCASGASALALAKDLITSGRVARVLVIGYDALTEYCWCGLTNLRTITTDRMRPFDVNRSGTIFSEGAAAMLVERSACRRGTALASLAGAATNNNAFHMTAPAKEADGSRRVMASAIAAAGLTPAAVDHVCAHATSTSANDVTEAAALRNLFGERLPGMTVAAHKSQLGHMMGAAGLAEAIITVEVLRNGLIPPTINHENPDPACMLDCVPGQARRRQVHCAVTNSAGIGGNNGSVVLIPADE